VYYVSKTLDGAKMFYTEMEKVAYAVVMASRKLKHYFQAHKITIPSSFPLDNIFKNPKAIGQIGKWATEINDFAIEFIGRNAIKSQALADFLADWTPRHSQYSRSYRTNMDSAHRRSMGISGSWNCDNLNLVARLQTQICSEARIPINKQ